MENKEIEKPEDYVEGGAEKMVNFLIDNYIQTIFILVVMVWLITAMWVSVQDIYNGNFEHKTLSYSFIIGIVMAGYLQIRKTIETNKENPTGVKKKKSCGKCGG